MQLRIDEDAQRRAQEGLRRLDGAADRLRSEVGEGLERFRDRLRNND